MRYPWNSLTLLLVDLLLKVQVYAGDDDVGCDVKDPDVHQDLGVVEGYLLRHLHHPEDDHQVGADG